MAATSRLFRSLIMAATLLSPLSINASTAAGSKDVLRIVPYQDITVFDPIVSSNSNGSSYGYLVYDTLFSLDADFKPQPQMVDSYTLSDDKLTYTFTLRPGLNWHDGKPVTAEDCIASIKRWASKDGMGRTLMGSVQSIDVIDDNNFKIVLSKPFPLTIAALARPNNTALFIMPKRFAETEATKPVAEAIGSGPYKLVKSELIPGSKVVFERNDAYVPRQEQASRFAGGKVAHFKRLEWVILKDPATALAALQRGEVDVWEEPPPDLVPVINANEETKTTIINPLGRMMQLRVNFLQPPFDNPKAREALQYITNQETYLQAAVGDPQNYIACRAMFFCGGPLETDAGSERLQHYDPAKATELFKESGWDFAKSITILQASDATHYFGSSLVLSEELKAIGLNPKLVPMDSTALNARRNVKGPADQGGWNAFITATGATNGIHPLTNNVAWANCDKAWVGWPCDAELEAIRAKFLTVSDPAEEKALVETFQKRAYDYGVFIPLGQIKMYVAQRTDLEGLVPSGDVYVYWNAQRKD